MAAAIRTLFIAKLCSFMPKSKYTLFRFCKWLFAICLFGLLISVGAVFVLYVYLSPELPSIEVLNDVRLQVPLRVYTSDGDLIAEFGEKRREPLQIEKIPQSMIKAFLAAEDLLKGRQIVGDGPLAHEEANHLEQEEMPLVVD